MKSIFATMAIQYLEINKLLYEINEKGERVLVRSTDSSRRAYLRFTNKTSRPVDIWWRDFRGTRHHYICLEPGTYFDVNSYISHPWEFTDVATNERYVINNSPIYRAPAEVGGMLYRTNWNITSSVRSLRHGSMIVIANMLRSPAAAQSLGLPKILEMELSDMITALTGPVIPPDPIEED